MEIQFKSMEQAEISSLSVFQGLKQRVGGCGTSTSPSRSAVLTLPKGAQALRSY